MKNSTILVVGTLGLVGAYLYLKGKKEPMLEEVVDNSLESIPTIPTTPTTPTIIPIAPPTTTIAPIAPIVPITYIITPPPTPTTSTAPFNSYGYSADLYNCETNNREGGIGFSNKELLTVGKYYNYVASGNFARNNKVKITNFNGGSVNGFNTQIQDKDKKDRIEDVLCQGFTNQTTGTIGKSVLSPLVDATLGLSPKPIIETETENYIKSKALSKGVQVLFQQMQNLQNELRNTMPSGFLGMFKKPSTDNREVIVAKINDVGKQMSENTAQAIALGYKILPLGEIEKL